MAGLFPQHAGLFLPQIIVARWKTGSKAAGTTVCGDQFRV
jgi:hypothetical protein